MVKEPLTLASLLLVSQAQIMVLSAEVPMTPHHELILEAVPGLQKSMQCQQLWKDLAMVAEVDRLDLKETVSLTLGLHSKSLQIRLPYLQS